MFFVVVFFVYVYHFISKPYMHTHTHTHTHRYIYRCKFILLTIETADKSICMVLFRTVSVQTYSKCIIFR